MRIAEFPSKRPQRASGSGCQVHIWDQLRRAAHADTYLLASGLPDRGRRPWTNRRCFVRTAVTALGLSLSVAGSSWAQQPVVGVATVVGSDRLTVNGTIYQLNGLDAVELQQSCYVDGSAWACGAAATRALQTLVDGVMVTCTPTGRQSG